MTTATLIGVPELADALGVDQSTVHRRIERGDLIPFTTVGKRPLFRSDDVEALARGERTLPKEPAAAELPEVGTLWRFRSSKAAYRVLSTEGELIQLQSTVTAHTRTSVPASDFGRRLVAVEALA